ncbi:MAG: hypothetical protein QOD95_2933 [Gammaproteobacteria bacterium]|nr:hypothetical protein [Gammaproteobacteria bacterium]
MFLVHLALVATPLPRARSTRAQRYYLLLVSVGEFARMLMRSGQYGASDLELAKWLVPTLAVYGWFAFRRFYGASRLYATFAAVVLLLGQGLIAQILNIAVIALLLVTA